MTIDFDRIKRDYSLPDIVAQSGVALQPDGPEFKACCPFHGEHTPSFTVYRNDRGWHYHCFGCGADGDTVDYVKERYGVQPAEAARIITGEDNRAPLAVKTTTWDERNNPYAGYDVTTPPDEAPRLSAGKKTPPLLNPKRVNPETGKPKVVTYTPTAAYPYEDRNGNLLGYVLRVEFDGRKVTPQIWWMKNKAANYEGWSHGAYPGKRPLYGLRELHESPGHQVLLVEGEKCKDAAVEAMADLPVTPVSWMGGGKSIDKTYWKSLKGRSVIIWPDNDEEGWRTTLGWAAPGMRWNKGLVELLFEAGATRIKVIHITRESRPEGWDIADAVYGTGGSPSRRKDDALPADAIRLIMKDRIREWSPQDIAAHRERELEKEGPQNATMDADIRRVNEEPQATPQAPDQGMPHGDASQAAEEPAGSHNGGADAGVGAREPGRELGPVRQDEPDDEAPLVGRGHGIDGQTWREHLIMKKDGDGLSASSSQNFQLLLQYEARFHGLYAYNQFSNQVMLMRRPPWDDKARATAWKPRPLRDTDVVSTQGFLEYCGMTPSRNSTGDAIMTVAGKCAFNPVQDTLMSLVWDGLPRLDRWLHTYLGADDTEINSIFGRKWVIAGVARAMIPGAKVDNMLILEGEQGLRKSTALKVLSDGLAPGLFTDQVDDVSSKDAAMQLQGRLIVEISELDAMRKADVNTLKAWIVRQNDQFRPPFGKIVESYPRSCIFAGTVNPNGNGYLKDPTGARRFWPVLCKHIDLEGLREIASQLWAEGKAMHDRGMTWWLEDEEQVEATVEQRARYEHDPWADLINTHLREMSLTTVTTIGLMKALQVPMERQDARTQSRIVAHLRHMGWKQKQDSRGDVLYAAPDNLV